MKQFIIRIKTCWEILTLKKRHWYLVSITTDELKKSLLKEEFDLDITHHKLQMYNVMELVRMHRNYFDEIDLLEQRLKFEYKAENKTKTR